jgi:hypothetical protein
MCTPRAISSGGGVGGNSTSRPIAAHISKVASISTRIIGLVGG